MTLLKVDLFVQSPDGTVYLFDLKTTKPNISNFKDFKRTLLEWVAIFLAQKPDAQGWVCSVNCVNGLNVH